MKHELLIRQKLFLETDEVDQLFNSFPRSERMDII